MVCWRIWKNLKNFEILWKVDFIVKLRFNFKNYSWVFPVKSTAKLTLNVGRHGWARKTFFFFTLYCLKRSETAFLISLNRKRWLSVKKMTGRPINFVWLFQILMETGYALIFRHLTPKKSRKMFIIEYITVLETLRKREAKQTQIKGKHPD